MAILKNGVLTGKLGDTVSYPLNGQVVSRGIGITKKPATLAQLAVRQKTKLLSVLLRHATEFVELGFALEVKNTVSNSYNRATALNWQSAISGAYPDQQIDFTKAIFSKGDIPVNTEVKVQTTDIGLEFTWNTELTLPGMKLNDHVMLIAYCPEKHHSFCILDGAKRKEGVENISIPRYHEKITVHTYVAFIASDRKHISDSLYTGTLLW
ncbi:DUF6266 family protein [Pedobacter sp. L105]|uniref:DUF6266 family protein n=1 Tax=Pedobacter sp. L105 TaxID=1641871 RepID=UPI00131C027D|nr:DUF6266 family protein [Pedobacter sp. L105]